MIRRFAPWTIVLALIVALVLPTLTLPAQGQGQGEDPDTSEQETLDTDVADPDDVDPTDEPDQDDDVDPTDEPEPTDEPDNDQNEPQPTDEPEPTDPPDQNDVDPTDEPDPTDVPDPTDEADQGITNTPSPTEPPVQAADPASIEIYCAIPDVNMPDRRTVGVFVYARAGYGNPTVTFTLLDLSGNPINPVPTGPSPLPNSLDPTNSLTASFPPNPNRWEWGPGGYSHLTVTAVYPTDPPGGPDSTLTVGLGCVPQPPTPTPITPTPITPTPPTSPTPIATAADYIPTITTEMKDTSGNIIPDDATVLPGTGIYDTAIISGLPPGTTGTVFFTTVRDNCTRLIELISGPHTVVADASGVAVVTMPVAFTVPGFPGGVYDWQIQYSDPVFGSAISRCGAETFNVVPPLPTSGTGTAILTCFLDDPPVPGRAGYSVNLGTLPSTGTVEVTVTLQISATVFDVRTFTLPPDMPSQLRFSGAYVFAWVNVIWRDATGTIYAVANLQGQCTATPGPTPTPTPPTPTATPITPTATPVSPTPVSPTPVSPTPVTPTPVTPTPVTPTPVTPTPVTPTPVTPTPVTPTTTPVSTGTPTATQSPTGTPVTPTATPPTTTPIPTGTPTAMPSPTVIPTSTATSVTTSTPAPTETPTPTTTQTPPSTATTEPVTPTPPPGKTPGPTTDLPNTGSGPDDPGGLATILVAAALLTAMTLWVTRRGHRSTR